MGGKYKCGLFERLRPASSRFLFHLGKSTVGKKGSTEYKVSIFVPISSKEKVKFHRNILLAAFAKGFAYWI